MREVVAVSDGLEKLVTFSLCGSHHLFCVLSPSCLLSFILWQHIHLLTMHLAITSGCMFARLPLHLGSLSCQLTFKLLVVFSLF